MKRLKFIALSLFIGFAPLGLLAEGFDDYGCVAVIYPLLIEEMDREASGLAIAGSAGFYMQMAKRQAVMEEYARCLSVGGFDWGERGISREDIERMRQDLSLRIYSRQSY